MRASSQPLKPPARTRTPLRLAVAVGAAALAWHASPTLLSGDSAFSSSSSSGETIRSAVDGVVRSSRAIYYITSVVIDYKYSLRNLPYQTVEYRSKLSEVHIRSAKRLLKLCEANKGFYVKAGQFVSSLRQVPKEYSSILSSLQDQAKPCNFRDIKEVIVKNLGKDFSELFLSIDEQPIAAASIAQVHRGLLKDNQEVAIKVQYPGLQWKMKIDISTMSTLSKFVSWIFPDYRFERVVSEFERTIFSELDFIQEAKNSEKAAWNLRRNNIVKIPLVFWDLTTRQVLTMEFCSGHRVDDIDFLKDSGINPTKVAKALMDTFAEMMFVHGFFHGDPHPGNILISPKDHKGFSLVLLDHGIYRELDEKFRLDFCQLWKALFLLDSQKIQYLSEQFGVGKYSKYIPIIFTGRTMGSKSALDNQMSNEEKRLLKKELRSLKMEDLSSFMESLPADFLSILKTDGLLRSIVSKLGAPRRVRFLAYAKYSAYGLWVGSNTKSDLTIKHALYKISKDVSYLQLRTVIEILAFLSQIQDLGYSLVNKFKSMLYEVVDFCYGRIYYLG